MSAESCLRLLKECCLAPFWWRNPFDFQTTLLAASVWEDSVPESWGQVLLAPTLQSNIAAMPGSFSLGEQQWPRPLAVPNLPSRSLAWGRAAGSSCFSVTPISRSFMPLADNNLAPSTGLAWGRQRSGPGQHLDTPQPFLPHLCCLF